MFGPIWHTLRIPIKEDSSSTFSRPKLYFSYDSEELRKKEKSFVNFLKFFLRKNFSFLRLKVEWQIWHFYPSINQIDQSASQSIDQITHRHCDHPVSGNWQFAKGGQAKAGWRPRWLTAQVYFSFVYFSLYIEVAADWRACVPNIQLRPPPPIVSSQQDEWKHRTVAIWKTSGNLSRSARVYVCATTNNTTTITTSSTSNSS